MSHQHRAYDSSGDKEDLARQHDAGQAHGLGPGGRVKAGELEIHQDIGIHPESRSEHTGQGTQGAQHRVEKCSRRAFAIVVQGSQIERRESDGESAPGQQIIQQVWDLEGRIVGIGARPHPHPGGQHHFSHEAEPPRSRHAGRQQQCRRAQAPRAQGRTLTAAIPVLRHVPPSPQYGLWIPSRTRRTTQSGGLGSRQVLPFHACTSTASPSRPRIEERSRGTLPWGVSRT